MDRVGTPKVGCGVDPATTIIGHPNARSTNSGDRCSLADVHGKTSNLTSAIEQAAQ